MIIYFDSSQCRLIPYLHQRPIFFTANSIQSSIVTILELIRGAQCLIEVIRLPEKKCDAKTHIKYRITAEVLRERSGLTRGLPIE